MKLVKYSKGDYRTEDGIIRVIDHGTGKGCLRWCVYRRTEGTFWGLGEYLFSANTLKEANEILDKHVRVEVRYHYFA